MGLLLSSSWAMSPRPIDAAIFGQFGDGIGRKKTLATTLLMTGFATFAVGLIPTYANPPVSELFPLSASGAPFS